MGSKSITSETALDNWHVCLPVSYTFLSYNTYRHCAMILALVMFATFEISMIIVLFTILKCQTGRNLPCNFIFARLCVS